MFRQVLLRSVVSRRIVVTDVTTDAATDATTDAAVTEEITEVPALPVHPEKTKKEAHANVNA